MMRLAALALCSLTVAACSDDSLGIADMNRADLATPDFAPGLDLSMPDFAGIACGAMTCSGSNVCCVVQSGMTATQMCMSSCPMGAVTASCDGPEDCSSGKPNCCVTLNLLGSVTGDADAGALGVGGGSAMCTLTCDPGLDSNNNVTSKLCHAESDCDGYTGTLPGFGPQQFDKCCTRAGIAQHFCAPATVMTFLQLKCL